MNTCLIFGQGGLDLCVTLNIRSFYKKLGYRVIFSTNLHDSDLLVVLRAIDKVIDISGYKFQQVHVYDYGGWDYDVFVNTIPKNITYIFSTSPDKINRIIHELGFPQNRIFVAVPPVDTKLWAKKIKPVIYNTVHIGNFKPINEPDTVKEKFNASLEYFKTNIWGMGWDKIKLKKLYHGKIGVLGVSNVYRKTKFAFGLMYPFQRNVTFSSRFFQAPLNGCILFSEGGLYTNISGVVETNYDISDLEKLMIYPYDRELIQTNAIKYWEDKNQCLLNIIRTLDKITHRKLVFDYKFYKIFLENHFRIIFQKFI